MVSEGSRTPVAAGLRQGSGEAAGVDGSVRGAKVSDRGGYGVSVICYRI